MTMSSQSVSATTSADLGSPLIYAISPTNFIMTNPELLKLTIESKGENLLKGLDNLLDDLERGPCQLQIKMTDLDAFEVGKDLAVTPGKIIFQNLLFL